LMDDGRWLDKGFSDVGRGGADAGYLRLDDTPHADSLHLLLMVARALEDVGLLELTMKIWVHAEEHLVNEVKVRESYGSNLCLGLSQLC
jgi:hypothetical protein